MHLKHVEARMEYKLICSGKLLSGADETVAIAELRALTGLSEKEIHLKLLTGKQAKLRSSANQAKIEALYRAFRKAGLDVELVSAPGMAATSGNTGNTPASQPVPQSPWGRKRQLIAAAALALLLFISGAAAYAWYWLSAPLPATAQMAEAAIADGRMVAIAHVNAEKLLELQHYLFGELDPDALPVDSTDKAVMDELFSGPANLRENLAQLFLAVHAPEGEPRARTTLLFSGNFDTDAVIGTLRRFYRVEETGDDHWHVLRAMQIEAESLCPSDTPNKREPAPGYLYITPQLALLADDQAHAASLVQRLQSGAPAAQDINYWQRYRKGQLASLMVLSIPEASTALRGLPGMVAQKAASGNAQITGVAAAVETDLLARGFNVSLNLASSDAAWKRDATAKMQRQLDEMKNDSRRVSPTLAELLTRITISEQAEALRVNAALDASVFADLGAVVQEGMGNLFSVRVAGTQQDGGQAAEQIQTHPKDYADTAAFATLPALKLESYDSQPLFMRGAFAVDVERIRMNDTGLLELQLQGRVALPDSGSDSGQTRTAELSLTVDSVTDAAGQDLLRDEHCVKRNELFGRSRNHEPETQSNIFQNKAQITKFVRLRENARLEDIQHIKGHLTFSAPEEVRKFTVPLRAGENITHAGTRFYLSSISDDSVSYHVTGEHARLLEVRGLNGNGQPLRTGWRMGGDDGRATQQFAGKIRALEVFVAGRFTKHQTDFDITNLFVPGAERENKPLVAFAPKRIDPKAWAAYKNLDMRKLKADPQDWTVFDKNKTPIASAQWQGVSLFLTHTPTQWGNSPQAQVYYPMLPDLPGVLSAFSYQIEEPAVKDGPAEYYAKVFYSYRLPSRELVVPHRLQGQPLALGSWPLRTGLKENERLDQLRGKLVFRLPTRTKSSMFALNTLWQGATVDGVTVSLTEVSRGMFPGYGLKIEGDISRLVNLHGIDADGRRVAAEPVNFQGSGYWTMTLPFGKGIESVELIMATKQEVMKYPFSLRPAYPGQ
ncbi:MAG: hypothetical protein RRB22_05780 [Gammaproteobacteria bacterium]|nr:hypothetical protein [Gammaproteobacteria bacterium]